MSSEPAGDRVQELFDQAVALSADQRTTFLEAACAGDPALRAEVEDLLAADAVFAESAVVSLLRSPLARASEPSVTLPPGHPATASPARIGHYRILRLIAEGGMGAVYEAEQDSPRRLVALKVVRSGLASPTLLERFRHEAQILGRLHHPGIAQVYEAGLAEDGQPFFAMEFIRGLRLDEYVRVQSLSVPARLELLARVCDAVQHAHDQGVIHRDLKPANILVDESGQPKVLDFGVARVTDVDLLTGAGLTQTGQLLGTPSYMSPEQLSGQPAAIDHRADVYALGVVLFELLTQRLPYRLGAWPLPVVARLILEEEPPRLGALDPELRGDVETIVARALEKDPARRYQSAANLAADLRRFLANEPILARPPSALYHLRKFGRRHKALVGGMAATMLALVVGLIGTIFFAVAEFRQRGQAEHNAGLALAEKREAELQADRARKASESALAEKREAELQADRARKASEAALREKREAELQAYHARLSAATSALEAHDVADAGRHLDAAPKELREWEWHHLRSRLDGSSSVIPLPAGKSPFLLADSDRLWVGVWTRDGLRLKDLEGGRQKTVPIGPVQHASHVTAAQTRQGLRVAGWIGPKAFQLRDEAGQILCRVEMQQAKRPEPIAVSPDGTRLASSWQDGEWTRLGVFDAATGKRTATCTGHRNKVWSYAFSPDSKTLASASEDQTCRLWDAATGKLLGMCQGHTEKVISVAFRPDGERLLSISPDGTVRQWDAATGREVEAPYDRHSGPVGAAAYSPCGQLVVSGGFDRTVRVWRATGRQDVTVLQGHTGPVILVAFAPDGRRLASFSGSWISSPGRPTVAVWDVDAQAPLPSLRGHTQTVDALAFSPDGRWIASGSSDRTVRLWDAATGSHFATLPHSSAVSSLAFGPDGKWLLTLQRDGKRLRIWDVATARVRKEFEGPPGIPRSTLVRPDGKRFVVTVYDGRKDHFHVCDVESGARLFSAEGRALAYSPDGRWLAVQVVGEYTVLLLDARTHETATRLAGHELVVWGAAFSPDSRCLATASRDRTVRLWQVEGGSCRVLRGHTDDVFAVAFHPDGKRLASAGRDRRVWLWDVVRGEEVARLPGHASFVRSLAFSPDGATLASGSGDATIRLWDTAPLKVRYQARREVEAVRPEALRLVSRLFAELREPAEVVSRLQADGSLSPALKRAALREVMRRDSK